MENPQKTEKVAVMGVRFSESTIPTVQFRCSNGHVWSRFRVDGKPITHTEEECPQGCYVEVTDNNSPKP